MTGVPSLTLAGAEILLPRGMVAGRLHVHRGRIVDDPVANAAEVDLGGYLILPGIVDAWSEPAAEDAVDPVTVGVTTVFGVVPWSWEAGPAALELAEARLAAAARGRQPGTAVDPCAPELPTAEPGVAGRDAQGADRRLALRVEMHTAGTTERLVAALRRHGADLVLFSDRLPEALERLRTDLSPGAATAWLRAEAALEGAGGVPRHLCRLAETLDILGIAYGSVGDRDAAAREYLRLIGARVCVAPQRPAPARAAWVSGDPLLLSAQEVLHDGPASDLVAAGLATGLVSGSADARTLAEAAVHLAADHGLGAAWALVSDGPAQALHLSDRGRIAPRTRADLCLVEASSRRVAGTLSGGRLVHATPDVRMRFGGGRGSAPMAAA